MSRYAQYAHALSTWEKFTSGHLALQVHVDPACQTACEESSPVPGYNKLQFQECSVLYLSHVSYLSVHSFACSCLARVLLSSKLADSNIALTTC